MNPTKIIIDTDPGLGEPGSDIDDGLAIALALASDELDVLGLTIVNGNVDAFTGTDVARRLTDRLGRPELPVLLGATKPLLRDMAPVRALFDAVIPAVPGTSDAGDLLGPTSGEHAADFLIRQVAEHPGEVTVVAIGPMTNVAIAITKDPSFAENVKELVLMAGSATGYAQNVTVVGDFNAYVDPEALDIVLRSGAHVAMVGLDQTSRVMLTRADAQHLRDRGDAFSVWVADCTDAWIDFLGEAFPTRPEHRDACFLHDPLVLAVVLDRTLCTWQDADVRTELVSELARGLVVANRGLALEPAGPTNAVVAIDTDVHAFRQLFLERIGTTK
ncbi:nucleoside hydrolase [Frondihabitans australicus]|uniref:Purine nucleosidase/uridine nucleosidase n=1 Tax=Frondihabitans australicus TaxID=386892 RepID=A0A495IKA8_9MICO|nr:nucleoside hydrolase [Frondihabitans australicus]RKR75868.1 purine nucleosidase/uridine nucleosidase [Frondihabitans australicus]